MFKCVLMMLSAPLRISSWTMKLLRKLGTALNSGSALFLYGPAGTGKTSIAETLSRVLAEDEVWIPYAVEVDGEIITVFDPSIHVRVQEREPEIRDERWVLCRRPSVLVGGELTAEMVDLQFNPNTKYYVGPVQMKANNGVLIVDDFGRQRLRPDELLNRWIVPLDRRIDFLTLAGGKKIEIPFEMLVVFASNMDPAELVDPAFLRRIQTKIKIGAVSDEQFCEIFRRVAAERGVKIRSQHTLRSDRLYPPMSEAGAALLLPAGYRESDLLGRAI